MVLCPVQMELMEMTAIVRQQDTLSGGGKRQHFGIRQRGISISGHQRCQHVEHDAMQRQ
jgi:hypothetical protein